MFQQGAFINRPGATPEEIRAKREVMALLKPRYGQARYVGEGLGHLATGIAQGFQDRRLRKQEEEGRASANDLFSRVVGGARGGSAITLGQPTAGNFNPAANATQPPATMASVPQGDMAGKIRQGLLQRGLPEHIADAFLLNFKDESGLNPGINEIEPLVPGSRGGFGLYQLTGPRRVAYERFAAQRGVDPANVDAQLDFLVKELQGPESRAAKSIFSAKDTGTAAAAIVNDFLRPAEQHRARREANYLGGAQPQFAPQQNNIAELQMALANPWLNAQQRAVIQSQIQQQQQANDPLRQMQLMQMQQQIAMNERELSQPPERFTTLSPEEAAAVQGGFQRAPDGRIVQIGGGGTNVTVNNQGDSVKPLGTKGDILIADPTAEGGFRVVQAEGSQAAREALAAETESERAEAQRQRASQDEVAGVDRVMATLDNLEAILDSDGMFNPAVGLGSGIGEQVRGSNANNYKAMAQTVEANIAFGALNQMRQNSPTGGALGQVTEKELELLKASVASLSSIQDEAQVRAQIQSIRQEYKRIMRKAYAYPNAEQYLGPRPAYLGDQPGADTESPAAPVSIEIPDFGAMSDEELDRWIEENG